MSEKIRIGNTYWHTECESNVVVTWIDHVNRVHYRQVVSMDNGGVIAAAAAVDHQPYREFLGATRTRDYPDDWDALAVLVRKRDDYQCQGCGLDQEDHDGRLPVHHIVPLGCGGTNTRRNLITLCEECHGRIHGGPI